LTALIKIHFYKNLLSLSSILIHAKPPTQTISSCTASFKCFQTVTKQNTVNSITCLALYFSTILVHYVIVLRTSAVLTTVQ